MGHDLVVIGLAFLLSGLLARAGARIGLPTIPLFVAAGMLVGPHTAGPVLFEHADELELLAAFGLVFLLFSLGIECTVEELTSGGGRLLAAAGCYLALNVGGGLALGFVLGWGGREAFVIAGATGISSSAIVTKVLVELGRLEDPESRLILGIIVIEDLFLALYLAALAPVLGQADSAADGVLLFLRALGFLLALAALARWGGGIVVRLLQAGSDELRVVLVVGFALLLAGVAAELGVSDAIGAFMAGLVLAGTTLARQVEHAVQPLRDAFAALFFFAFGLAIDPGDVGPVLGVAAIAILVTLVLAMVAGAVAARLHRLGTLEAVRIGTTTAARGEFALILVTLAASAGLDDRLAPFVAAYVLVLAVIAPVLAHRASSITRTVQVVRRRTVASRPKASTTARSTGTGSRSEARAPR